MINTTKILFNLYDKSPGRGRGAGGFYYMVSLINNLLLITKNRDDIIFIFLVNKDYKSWGQNLKINERCKIINLGFNIKLFRPL